MSTDPKKKNSVPPASAPEIPTDLAAFGSQVFNQATMERELKFAPDSLKSLKDSQMTGKPLDKVHANVIAKALQGWAMRKGAVTFTQYAHALPLSPLAPPPLAPALPRC